MRFRPSPGRHPSWVLLLAAWTALLGTRTFAAPGAGGETTTIDFSASGCGSLAELTEQVERRSSRIRLEPPSGTTAALKAAITGSDAEGRAVVLTIVQASRQPFARRVKVKTCDEAVETLALLIVLALDRDAVASPVARTAEGPPRVDSSSARSSTVSKRPSPAGRMAAPADGSRPRDAPTPVGADEPVGAGRLDVTAPVPTAARPAEMILRPVDARSIVRSAPPAETSPRPRAPVARLLTAGAGGLAITGPAPGAMVGGSLDVVWGWDRASPWSPSIAIGLAHAERNGWAASGGTASFALTAIRLDLCPLWAGMHHRFGARACALGVVGALTAEGTQTLAPEVHRRAFALFGGSAALSYEPGARVSLLASGGVGSPIERYAFQFSPAVFHRVAAVCVMMGLVVSVRFY